MALTTKGMFDLKVWDDIGERCKKEEIASVIDNRVQLFYPINTELAIRKLIQLGDLLQLAYAGSRSYGACSVHVIKVVSVYQELVKKTVASCTRLTNVVLQALSFHKPALIYAEKEKPGKAIAFLGKCVKPAGDMADECGRMMAEIEAMCSSVMGALRKLNDNFTGADEEKLMIVDRINKLDKYIETKIQKANELEAKVEEALKIKAEEINTSGQHNNNKLKLVYNLLGPISYIESNSEIKSNELKLFLQNESRNVNDDLQDSIECLKTIDYSTSDITTSLVCLEVSIKLLEKIRTMFSNGKLFWNSVRRNSKVLAKTRASDELRDYDVFEACKKAFINEIKTSGLGWLASGKICRQAALDIRNHTHGGVCTDTNLFEPRECSKLIQGLSDALIGDILEENEKIEDVKSDWLYEVLVDPTIIESEEKEEDKVIQAPFNYLLGWMENNAEVVQNGHTEEEESEVLEDQEILGDQGTNTEDIMDEVNGDDDTSEQNGNVGDEEMIVEINDDADE